MEYLLGKKLDGPVDSMESFRILKESENSWSAFKLETTPAEYESIELLWDIYQSNLEVVKGGAHKLQALAADLNSRIPLKGSDANEVTWAFLHGTLVTAQVILG